MPRKSHTSPQTARVFRAFLDQPEAWRHGYDLLQEAGLKSGTLYPLLVRLAKDGLLESEWQEPVPPARAPRHAYRLTGKGRAFALDVLAKDDASDMSQSGAALA